MKLLNALILIVYLLNCNANAEELETSNDEPTAASLTGGGETESQGETNSIKPFIEGDTIVNATRGKSAVLTCVVHNVKNYKITWFFNGILLTLNEIRIKDDKRYSVENLHPNEWKLVIDPVDSSNEGQYSCRLMNGMKKTIYLKVGVAPTFVENNGSHQILINTVEKQNITLSCEAEGNPTPIIYWYRHNSMISTGPHLIIKDINRHSHTEYECVARNNIEPDPSRHFKINVSFKPTLNMMYYLKEVNKKLSTGNTKSEEVSTTSNTGSINDGDLQLVCEITGYPINSITWFKDGQKVKDETHVSTTNSRPINYRSSNNLDEDSANDGSNKSNEKRRKKHVSIHTSQLNSHKFISKLKVKNFDKTDNGMYKCSVNGFEGEYSKTIVIEEIKGQPSSEVEYTFNIPEKNPVKSGKDKIFKLSTSKTKNLEMNNNQLVEGGYLVNERARGARSNMTKNEQSYELELENTATKFSLSVFAIISSTTSVWLLFGWNN